MLLIDDRFGRAKIRGDLAANLPDTAQVGAAVVALRRADGDEDDLGLGDPVGQVRREPQPAVAQVAMHELAQPGLIDRNSSLRQPFDLTLDLVDAYDVVSALCQAGSLHQSNISRSDDCDLHDDAILLKRPQYRQARMSAAGRTRSARVPICAMLGNRLRRTICGCPATAAAVSHLDGISSGL